MDDSDININKSSPRKEDSNLDQVKPGTPLGIAKHHIYTHARHALGLGENIAAAYHRIDLTFPLKKRILGFLGNFGSGKTEVAVNLAVQLGLAAMRPDDPYDGPVSILDLDIVNPYFRSREAAVPLEKAGVEVVTPRGEHFWADLPIILPEIKGRIQSGPGTMILDVGGDDMGARVLSHLKDEFKPDNYTLMMVVNANRPFTSSIEGAGKVLRELEGAAGLNIGGLVSNTHMMDETDAAEIRRGYEFTLEMGKLVGLPVVLVAVEARLLEGNGADRIKVDEFGCPVLPLYRFMLPPWRGKGK